MAVQNPPIAGTWQEALEECIVAMKDAAKPLVLAAGVEDWLRKKTAPKFEKNFNLKTWPSVHDKVIAASVAIGRIANILAGLTDSTTISQEVLSDAIKAVKVHCTAKLHPDSRYVFCPD